ncbi:MAG: ribonuclease J [Erysipelotrichaceae bacterium]|nr:ribonuclease J [Erysipelotrichaceae bacterium]MCR5095713.1 ribonuclease J [Erysipelotrichaceae bacterium]
MQKVRLMALGGLDEDGKNMYLVEIDGDIFVVDAGLKYPNENEQLGIEYIIPDFTYLLEHKDRIKGIFISHGHDDVMSALPHLLLQLDADVYATALTARILEEEFKRHKLKNKHIHIIKRKQLIEIAGHKIRTFPVMQSIADGVGFAFETDSGLIVYTSEFVFDYDLLNQAFSMDLNTLSNIGQNNVLVLMSESTGASRPGYTAPKHRISDHIEHFFEESESRIIVTLYRQNLFRIMEILELAAKYKKKVFFYNEDHVKLLKIVEDLNYYKIPRNVIIGKDEFNNDISDVVCVVSGPGNEVFKLMNNIAIGEDNVIELRENDTVIIASPVVPGTEKDATAMENDLYKAGVNIYKLKAREVLSMHASIEDLKMMLYMIRPKYYLPIKGEYSDLINNADIAVEMGYTPDKIIILDNGQFASFENGRLASTSDFIELEDKAIDASDMRNVSGMVLKDREKLSTDGAIICGVVLDFKTKKVIGGPDIQSRGVIYLKDADHILSEIGNILISTIERNVKENTYENMQVRMEAREQISHYVMKSTGKAPMILPAIVEIDLGEESGKENQ